MKRGGGRGRLGAIARKRFVGQNVIRGQVHKRGFVDAIVFALLAQLVEFDLDDSIKPIKPIKPNNPSNT
jgi:hypothetical protein